MLGIYCRTSRDNDFEKSTIIQQKQLGIKFAEQHNFEYEIYEDEGISGYRKSDNDLDPFSNRPAFTKLINDIKSGSINKVWVWEHSRLSRNYYTSAIISNIFEQHNITLYENNKEFKIDDPQLKFMRQMLDAVAEYERQLIIERTTRGTRKRINEGKRAHVKLYGYGKSGKDESGYTIWTPIESELNTVKHAISKYMQGDSLSKVCTEIYDMNKIEKKLALRRAFTLGRILRKYQYTGYQLTIEGYDIFKSFRKNEIESVHILLDRKYWVKSKNYPVEIITIDDWVKLCERLQIISRNKLSTNKNRILRADKDIATGIAECNECGVKFYYKDQTTKSKKSEKTFRYLCYYHLSTMTKSVCKQTPRSFKLDSLNEKFKTFYFHFMLIFDNRNEQIRESQRNIKQTQLKINEKIAKLEKEVSATERRIDRLNARFDNIADDLFELLLRQIKDSETKLDNQNTELSKLKIDYELQNDKFNRNEREMTYYDVKERINDWFFNFNKEEQRNELVRVIKKCLIFNRHLLIDTGKVVFLFDIKDGYVFDMNLLENLNRDIIYKEYYIEYKNIGKAKKHNDKKIPEIDFDRNENARATVYFYLLDKFGINYSFTETNKFVPFVSMRGLYSQNE